MENNEYEKKIRKLKEENETMKSNESSLKEQIESKEKELIQLRIKLKEIKSLNNATYLYNTNNNTNNYRSKSNLSKSNSSINIYKDNLTDKKENNNTKNFTTNVNNINLFNKKNNNSIYNNKHTNNQIKKIKRNTNHIHNHNITLSNCNSTISLQNYRKFSHSKAKKKYNNSINYFNKKYINNLTTILLKEPKNKKKYKKIINKNSGNTSNIVNKSMLDLFPSRNLTYLLNNNKYKSNYNNSNIHNSNKKKNKDNKSLNITHNTINMNKNNVMINLNANIINTNTPIENYKVQQKLLEYKKYINKKLNEFNKGKKVLKNSQIFSIPNKVKKSNNKKKEVFSTCSVHYKRINKHVTKKTKPDDNKRKNSPNKIAKNVKMHFNSNSFNKITTLKKNINNSVNSIDKKNSRLLNLTKNNYDTNTYNVKKNPTKIINNINFNSNNSNINVPSRSSSNNSKSSLNIMKNKTKSKTKNKFVQKPTLKNFVFIKSGI